VTLTLVPGRPNLLLGAFELASLGYQAQEYFVSGSARSFGPAAGPPADYTTRIVVLRPLEPAAGADTAIVEWLNVSGGIDAPAFWLMAHREIARAGHVHVAVSAQRVGVEGGGVSIAPGMSLKELDPQRYSDLSHPGDAYCYDMFSQIGRLVRDGAIEGVDARTVLAAGESQSAMFLTTYINEVDGRSGDGEVCEVFDGFLVHSRFGSAAPLDGVSILDEHGSPSGPPAPYRADLRVPVLTVITETDVLGAMLPGYRLARQPETPRLRVWEIPGSAHADIYTIRVGFIDNGSLTPSELAAAYAPTDVLMGEQLPYFINFAPQHHYVLQAAIPALREWVRTGRAPSSAPPIQLTDSDPAEIRRDERGVAVGGVRTPWVDVPTAVTTGTAAGDQMLALLFGTGEPFDPATLAELYPGGADEYLRRFTESLDRTIAAGFLCAADRAEILQLAGETFRGTP